MSPRAPADSRSGLRHALAATAPVVLGVVAALASAPGASAATSCPDADGRPAQIGAVRASAAVACLVNHERDAVGLAPLTWNARAAQAAQQHADDMAARNYFAHAAPAPAPGGTTPQDRLDHVGYDWSEMAENIARAQPTPRSAMAAWLASPPHCAALMSPATTNLGTGVSSADSGPYWVEVFARPATEVAGSGPAVPCPRTAAVPAPDGAPASGGAGGSASSSGGGTGTASGTGTGSAGSSDAVASQPLWATAKRQRRRLSVRVSVPSAGSGRAAIAVRVQQRGHTVRTLHLSLTRGRVHVVRLSLPTARAGRVRATAGRRAVGASFR